MDSFWNYKRHNFFFSLFKTKSFIDSCLLVGLFAVYMAGRNDINGDCGLGHLTFKGYKQQELNGQNLRMAYVETGFLSPNYSSHEVFFRTDGE